VRKTYADSEAVAEAPTCYRQASECRSTRYPSSGFARYPSTAAILPFTAPERHAHTNTPRPRTHATATARQQQR